MEKREVKEKAVTAALLNPKAKHGKDNLQTSNHPPPLYPNHYDPHSSFLISSTTTMHHHPPPPPLAMSQYYVLFLLSTTLSVSYISFGLPLPLLVLLSLKSSLSDPLSSLHSWNYSSSTTNLVFWCSWSGVTCDNSTGDVTGLNLSYKNLSGTISPELRLLYHSLLHLNLSGNSFRGPLPQTLFDLRRLRTLDISHNDFNSTFPTGISRLRCLIVFNAYSNSFIGPVPPDIVRLRLLEYLNLGGSFFSGHILEEIGGLSKLRCLHLAGNLLAGKLPEQLGSLRKLEHLEIGYNSYEGGLPGELGRLTSLRYLDISSANLSGALPQELGNLSQLESLFLFKNGFSGGIPASFVELKALKELDLSDNQLLGIIPPGFSSFYNLTILSLMNNELSGGIPTGIGHLPSLSTLLLWNNSLTGKLPPKLGLNGRLEKLDVSSNNLTGPLPLGLCSGDRLVRLILFSNRFNSELPAGLANCSSLWRIRIEGNRLSGVIPFGFGRLPNLTYMDLSRNNFSGGIPSDLVTAPTLEFLNVSENPLRSGLPESIWSSPALQIFAASSCGLVNNIPSFSSGCRNLCKVELENNELNGSIPMDVARCQRLISLKLDRNKLTGTIPPELAELPSITDIDLASNDLSGAIPASFDNCSTLESLNVSFNGLSGQVPSSGPVLRNLHPSSFAGNDGLCGWPVAKPCAQALKAEQQDCRRSAEVPIVWIAAAAVGAGLVVLILGARWTRADEAAKGPGPWWLTAFQRLNFTAEDVAECVSASENIIGMGSTGAVYRADMPNGEVIAVKKLWGKQKNMHSRKRDPVTEVEVLGTVRHRNIVRLLGCCSNRETTMLLYEYMPNGSLEDLLHRKKKGSASGKGEPATADWTTRYQIAMGVAQGICYLHHDCTPVIVHRDVKPSNILLDAGLEARVADFGLAKLIQANVSSTMSTIAGSYGYIAPEYAYTAQVDEKSDVYSYGVVLMEMVSGRRTVEAEFGEGRSIVEWAREKVAKGQSEGGAWELLDREAGAECEEVREEMMLVLRVALLCTSRNPADRPSMRDVVSMLREAKPNRKPTGGVEGLLKKDGAAVAIQKISE